LIDGAVVQTEEQNFGVDGESDLDLEYAISLGRLLMHSASHFEGVLTKCSLSTAGNSVPNR
jgi:hypothetical protein